MRVEAPVCGGSGAELPGLLGLRTIEEKRGVIETSLGQAYLTFPGPGGYTVNWAPGAVHLPLSKAPSGHLCVELDHYEHLVDDPAVPPARQITLLSLAGSPADRRVARAEDTQIRAEDGDPPTEHRTLASETHRVPPRHPCTFTITRQRKKGKFMEHVAEGPADTETICNLPCCRGTLSHGRGAPHEHEGECRCYFHFRNRNSDGDG